MLLTPPSTPDLSRLTPLSPGDVALLKTRGIEIAGAVERNEIYLHPEFVAQKTPLAVYFVGSNNKLYIDKDCGVGGFVKFEGSDGTAIIMGGQPLTNLVTAIYDHGTLVWGSGSLGFQVRAWVHGERKLLIGEDCLFSEAITFHTSDHHSIIDLKTKKQTNFPADIRVGRHVWLGPDVSVTKGVDIGDGSIVAKKSLVIRSVPHQELWAGAPARCIRRDVSWVPSLPALPAEIESLSTRYGLGVAPAIAATR